MAKLINGNGNPAIYANQDADLIASLAGNITAIAAVGNEFAATQEDANTIGLADGVIITKEGRRIQLDDGNTDLFSIPTGTAGTTSYYIIGYKLSTQADSSQTCETFVQKMNSSSETITEDTFKGGATDVYVSVYRVTQDGLNIDSIDLLLPNLENISEIKSALTGFSFRVSGGKPQYSTDGGTTWNDLGGGGGLYPDLQHKITDLTLGSNNDYTVQKDCYLLGCGTTGTGGRVIRVNGQGVGSVSSSPVVASVPVQAGDVISCAFTISAASDTNMGLALYEFLQI